MKIVKLDVSLTPMTDRTIPAQYRGWWRIVDTGTWVNDGLDILGPVLTRETAW